MKRPTLVLLFALCCQIACGGQGAQQKEADRALHSLADRVRKCQYWYELGAANSVEYRQFLSAARDLVPLSDANLRDVFRMAFEASDDRALVPLTVQCEALLSYVYKTEASVGQMPNGPPITFSYNGGFINEVPPNAPWRNTDEGPELDFVWGLGSYNGPAGLQFVLGRMTVYAHRFKRRSPRDIGVQISSDLPSRASPQESALRSLRSHPVYAALAAVEGRLLLTRRRHPRTLPTLKG